MPSGHRRHSPDHKVRSGRALEAVLGRAKRQGETIAFTNGCFDVLHAGHIRLLEFAKRQGGLLVVAMNSDRSVRRLKGPGRPFMGQRDRALILAALESVDYVTVFSSQTPRGLIKRYRPDVLVKGADWASGEIVGRDVVERYGGRVVRYPLVRGQSSTSLIRRLRARRR